jgi:hypothetical protein
MKRLTVAVAAATPDADALVRAVNEMDLDTFISAISMDGSSRKSGGPRIAFFLDALDDDDTLPKTYQKFLDKFAIPLGKEYAVKGSLLPLFCPSVICDLKIRVPSDFMMLLPKSELVDELFGAVYAPQRWRIRFQSDFHKRLADYFSHTNMFLIPDLELVISTPKGKKSYDELVDIYGEKQLRMFWEKAGPQVRQSFIDMDAEDLVELLDAGLK